MFERVKNIFKRDSEESEFRGMYLSLIASVYDFRNILKGVPLCFVDDLPISDINLDYTYVQVRGSHPYYYLEYYRFDSDKEEWIELDLVGMRGLL